MNIYGMTLKDLEDYFLKIGEKKFKAIQVYDWLYKKRVNSFDEMTNVKKSVIKRRFCYRTVKGFESPKR